MYFSKRENIVTPYFSQIMTENRFHLLLEFLHFADNSKFDPDQHQKKIYKIQPILDHLKPKFSSVYTPERSICVDESLLLWKGRLGWIQHIPSKEKQVWSENLQTLRKQHRLFGTSKYTRCDQNVLRLIFYSAVGTLRDTPVCRVVS